MRPLIQILASIVAVLLVVLLLGKRSTGGWSIPAGVREAQSDAQNEIQGPEGGIFSKPSAVAARQKSAVRQPDLEVLVPRLNQFGVLEQVSRRQMQSEQKAEDAAFSRSVEARSGNGLDPDSSVREAKLRVAAKQIALGIPFDHLVALLGLPTTSLASTSHLDEATGVTITSLFSIRPTDFSAHPGPFSVTYSPCEDGRLFPTNSEIFQLLQVWLNKEHAVVHWQWMTPKPSVIFK